MNHYHNCHDDFRKAIFILLNIALRELKRKHKHGPLFVDIKSFVSQYKEIIFDKYHFIIRHQSNPDCYALLKDGTITQIFNIVVKNSTNGLPKVQQIHHINFNCKQFMKYDNYLIILVNLKNYKYLELVTCKIHTK